ncbi:MAG: hypothetical protein M3O71_23800 [Bacteroidota bacterium]|nr:hypothetical protein [Bacteroidota bacterium]
MRRIIISLLSFICLFLTAAAQTLDIPAIKALTPFNNIKGIRAKTAPSAKKLTMLYFSTQTQRTDTSTIKTFDQDGRIQDYILFEGGHRTDVLRYSYHDRPGVKEEWHDQGIKGKNHSWLIVDTVFDKSGKIIETDANTVTNKDTTFRNQYYFKYDKDGLLQEKDCRMNRQLVRVTNYYYQQGKIAKERENSQPAGPGKFQVVMDIDYTYNDKGAIVKVEKSYARTTGKQLLEFHNYTYTDNNILSAESFSYVGPTQKTTNVAYEFNPDGTLGSMVIKKDTLYKNVQYQYKNKKLTGIHMVTNAPNDLFHGYFAMVTHSRMISLPVSLDEKFIYDMRGNIVEKQQISLGGLLNRWSYEYEYY